MKKSVERGSFVFWRTIIRPPFNVKVAGPGLRPPGSLSMVCYDRPESPPDWRISVTLPPSREISDMTNGAMELRFEMGGVDGGGGGPMSHVN